ncbi:hypothetical protein ACLOJK_003024 [Asimina triloba]
MIDLGIRYNKLVSEFRLFGPNRSSRLRSHQHPIPAAAALSFVGTPPICDDTRIGIWLHPPVVVSTPPATMVAATIHLSSASSPPDLSAPLAAPRDHPASTRCMHQSRIVCPRSSYLDRPFVLASARPRFARPLTSSRPDLPIGVELETHLQSASLVAPNQQIVCLVCSSNVRRSETCPRAAISVRPAPSLTHRLSDQRLDRLPKPIDSNCRQQHPSQHLLSSHLARPLVPIASSSPLETGTTIHPSNLVQQRRDASMSSVRPSSSSLGIESETHLHQQWSSSSIICCLHQRRRKTRSYPTYGSIVHLRLERPPIACIRAGPSTPDPVASSNDASLPRSVHLPQLNTCSCKHHRRLQQHLANNVQQRRSARTWPVRLARPDRQQKSPSSPTTLSKKPIVVGAPIKMHHRAPAIYLSARRHLENPSTCICLPQSRRKQFSTVRPIASRPSPAIRRLHPPRPASAPENPTAASNSRRLPSVSRYPPTAVRRSTAVWWILPLGKKVEHHITRHTRFSAPSGVIRYSSGAHISGHTQQDKPEEMDDKTWDKLNHQACGTIRLCLAKDQKYFVMK